MIDDLTHDKAPRSTGALIVARNPNPEARADLEAPLHPSPEIVTVLFPLGKLGATVDGPNASGRVSDIART